MKAIQRLSITAAIQISYMTAPGMAWRSGPTGAASRICFVLHRREDVLSEIRKCSLNLAIMS